MLTWADNVQKFSFVLKGIHQHTEKVGSKKTLIILASSSTCAKKVNKTLYVKWNWFKTLKNNSLSFRRSERSQSNFISLESSI